MKKTPLNQLHKDLGAKMTNFGGWEMPVEYTGIIEEHRAVRNQCGLFDISHMGEILVSGEKAFESLQRIITNDMEKLEESKIIYTPICNNNR
jgi:aminomethyltransferase